MKKILLFIFLLLIVGAAYLTGSRGTDPAKWFVTPTPTPMNTPTATFTVTTVATATNTPTATATSTPTPTPVPKHKKAAKKPVKSKKKKAAEKEVEVDEDVQAEEEPKAPPPAPPQPPEHKPICNASALAGEAMELEPNNTFLTAQNLDALTAKGLQVHGTLSKVIQTGDSAAADAYKVDPKVESPDLDVDVYQFSATTPFLVVLDCYTHVVGRPDPLYHDNNFQLEIYNESFEPVGSSTRNDPVEAVEISETGKTFYAVVYGVEGTPGNYRLTITQK